MNISDEQLMAYADGELDSPEHATERTSIEAALRANPDFARRVEAHRALRRKLSATYDRVLDEPVPDRLVTAIRNSATSNGSSRVAPDAARAGTHQRDDIQFAATPRSNGNVSYLNPKSEKAAHRSRWSSPTWFALAASVIIGVLIGHYALKSRELSPVASENGRLVAQAGLADALNTQLASEQPATAPIRLGTSFKNKSGQYCRTFVLNSAESLAGLACNTNGTWSINTLAKTEPAPNTNDGSYRQAGSELPAAIRTQVESQILGDPLDSSGEQQAKATGWK